ncbi:MAG: hypothetical protein ACYC1L_17410 [Alphaproteobacteria bacterium]
MPAELNLAGPPQARNRAKPAMRVSSFSAKRRMTEYPDEEKQDDRHNPGEERREPGVLDRR